MAIKMAHRRSRRPLLCRAQTVLLSWYLGHTQIEDRYAAEPARPAFG